MGRFGGDTEVPGGRGSPGLGGAGGGVGGEPIPTPSGDEIACGGDGVIYSSGGEVVASPCGCGPSAPGCCARDPDTGLGGAVMALIDNDQSPNPFSGSMSVAASGSMTQLGGREQIGDPTNGDYLSHLSNLWSLSHTLAWPAEAIQKIATHREGCIDSFLGGIDLREQEWFVDPPGEVRDTAYGPGPDAPIVGQINLRMTGNDSQAIVQADVPLKFVRASIQATHQAYSDPIASPDSPNWSVFLEYKTERLDNYGIPLAVYATVAIRFNFCFYCKVLVAEPVIAVPSIPRFFPGTSPVIPPDFFTTTQVADAADYASAASPTWGRAPKDGGAGGSESLAWEVWGQGSRRVIADNYCEVPPCSQRDMRYSGSATASLSLSYDTGEGAQNRFAVCPDFAALVGQSDCYPTGANACCELGGPCGKIDPEQSFRWSYDLRAALAISDEQYDTYTGDVFRWLADSGARQGVIDAGTDCTVANFLRSYTAGSAVNTDWQNNSRIAQIQGANNINGEQYRAALSIEPNTVEGIGREWLFSLEAGVYFSEAPIALRLLLGALRIRGVATPANGFVISEAFFQWNTQGFDAQNSTESVILDTTINPNDRDDLTDQIQGTVVGAGSPIGSPCLSSARVYPTIGPMVDVQRVCWFADVNTGAFPSRRRVCRIRLDISNIVTLLNIGVCPEPAASQSQPVCDQCGSPVVSGVCLTCGKYQSQPCAGCGA